MQDSLMVEFTWAGQLKKGSKKETGLALSKSKLAKTIFEAVKYDDLKDVTILTLEGISRDYVRRAGD
ncbi:hypothetical protein DAPPUDRAFT_334783 [Daphnia pulex]|uniref:Uncharacterized protein n=1 Tax=Daphnia pulex TaxID=6669 RepID=E9HWD0_DAPPU|nr:hypothetical protein DAPPUDRAFT_334783 [Daphnia pulex]|eukprot:EFX63950.1 hypothetical protein DAPPUDRAFT_334783 [Daphnia pulex]